MLTGDGYNCHIVLLRSGAFSMLLRAYQWTTAIGSLIALLVVVPTKHSTVCACLPWRRAAIVAFVGLRP
eukprot:COSAG02_NODE_66798_length_254_cov_1.000000_1_plen_68_part_01